MLKVKLLHPDAKAPTRANATDAGLDLYAAENYVMLPGSWAPINTGISVAFPDGYMGAIRPRSGFAVRYGIDVLAGTVDSSYRGVVMAVLINHGVDAFRIQAGDRIAQLVIQKVELWTPQVVDELDETKRGDNGFGSSGKR